jgi:uncharacterized membrane protein
MANITVWKFESATGATEALIKLADLQRQHHIVLIDAATVTWPKGKKHPRTRQAVDLVGRGALDGAFWGMLFGFLFFVPMLGMAVGAAVGGIAGRFKDYGIDDDFITNVKSKVTEGTSALFLLSGASSREKVQEAFQNVKMELISSNLSDAQEAELRAAFGNEAE